ncbi:MAG: 2Fe-2S ferredoxin [Gammaproteobacteria bacterium]|nr:2Fe-2S ferredoxin [Gammaproteobacteria bacterium]
MAFEKICTLEEVWEGEMAGFTTANGTEVLLIGLQDYVVRAVQQTCPHQQFSLADGILDRHVLTCRAHLWQFDVRTDRGINPSDCALAVYPTKVEGDDVYIDVAQTAPLRSHS